MKKFFASKVLCRFLMAVPFIFPLSVFAEAAPISIAFAHTGNPPEIVSGYRMGSHYFLSADEMARLYRAQIYWRPVSKIVELSRLGKIVAFKAHAGDASVSGKIVPLQSPIVWKGSGAWIPVSFLESSAFADWSGIPAFFDAPKALLTIGESKPVSTAVAASHPQGVPVSKTQPPYGHIWVRKLRIVIDPGHGGKDPGARGIHGTLEKDINLKAGLELARLLEKTGVFEVRLTRHDDTFISLSRRSEMANNWKADLFVSLHSNAAKDPRDSGFETYFMSEKASDPHAQRLAEFENSSINYESKFRQQAEVEMLLGELSKTEYVNASSEFAGLVSREASGEVNIPDRGVEQAGFYVLRGTHAPAILFEMGYLTNPKDEQDLRNENFRRRLMRGLYAGIVEYAKKIKTPKK